MEKKIESIKQLLSAMDLPHDKGVDILESFGWSYSDRFELSASQFVKNKVEEFISAEAGKAKKLVADYESQIFEYDRKLEITKKAEAELRGENFDKNKIMERDELREERNILNAQHQRTVQFISDLKYL